MKLRKCHCGGNPLHYPLDFQSAYNDELRHIECDNCGFSTVSYWNGNWAMRNWNFLQRQKLQFNYTENGRM